MCFLLVFGLGCVSDSHHAHKARKGATFFIYQLIKIIFIMKTFNLSDLRKAVKNAKTPCAIVKQLYVYAEENSELKKQLPKKQILIDAIPTICEKYNVGSEKVVTMKSGAVRKYIIKFSLDMVLRYIAAENKTK